MRKIKLIWETSTGELSVDSFENITRNDLYEVELFHQSRGSNFLLPEDAIVSAIAKQRPDGAVLCKVEDFTRPTNALLPYTAQLWIGGEDLDNSFLQEEGEAEYLDLKFELQSSEGPNTSARVSLRVHNELTRSGEEWMPPGVKAQGGRVNVQVIRVPGGQWVKPHGAQLVKLKMVSGASSGGEPSYPNDSLGLGGVGGYPGRHYQAEMLADLLPDTVEVLVGKGGAKGAGEAGGDTVFDSIVVQGAPAPSPMTGNYSGQHNFFGVFQLTSALRTLFAGGGQYGGQGGAPTNAQQQTTRISTGGGGGGSCQVNWPEGHIPGEAWDPPISIDLGAGGPGGAIGTGSSVPITPSLGGSLPAGGGTITDPTNITVEASPNRHGQNGRYDPLSGMCTGAGGGAAGYIGTIEAGDGGDGAFPGGAAGGGGAGSGHGGKGGDGLVVIETLCA